jgi:Family of unknown function (DUF5995)
MELPQTIDGVIAALETIVKESIERRSRLGYFAALYNRVTETVRQGIAAGTFDDGPRMERLDVTFACRYLAAYNQYRTGELPSRSWLKAFRAAESGEHIVLQQLLVGMNAHINLDLGVAAARTSPGAELAGLRDDFDRINDILASLTPTVEEELDEESSVFRELTTIAPKLELKLVGFAMDEARHVAWSLATELAPLPIDEQLPAMARRDDETLLLGDAILCDNLLVRDIRRSESTDVARNIELLAQGEFPIRLR